MTPILTLEVAKNSPSHFHSSLMASMLRFRDVVSASLTQATKLVYGKVGQATEGTLVSPRCMEKHVTARTVETQARWWSGAAGLPAFTPVKEKSPVGYPNGSPSASPFPLLNDLSIG